MCVRVCVWVGAHACACAPAYISSDRTLGPVCSQVCNAQNSRAFPARGVPRHQLSDHALALYEKEDLHTKTDRAISSPKERSVL